MSQSVTIKSNKYGINLVLDPEIGFDELLKDVVEKFKASSTFFKNAKLALSFEGRKPGWMRLLFPKPELRNAVKAFTR